MPTIPPPTPHHAMHEETRSRPGRKKATLGKPSEMSKWNTRVLFEVPLVVDSEASCVTRFLCDCSVPDTRDPEPTLEPMRCRKPNKISPGRLLELFVGADVLRFDPHLIQHDVGMKLATCPSFSLAPIARVDSETARSFALFLNHRSSFFSFHVGPTKPTPNRLGADF